MMLIGNVVLFQFGDFDYTDDILYKKQKYLTKKILIKYK